MSRRGFWSVFVIGMLGCVGCAAMSDVFAKSPVTPDEAAGMVDDGVTLGECQEKGRAAKDAGVPDAYGVYEDCTREAGLR